MIGRRVSILALLSLCAVSASARGMVEPATATLAVFERDELLRVLLLRDYNTRIVVAGATLLGLAGGVIGSFTLLRKRALLGDALSHATLPGIGIAYLISLWLGGQGKSLPMLLAGATIAGLLGLGVVLVIHHLTRLKEDTALGVVLSVFFGAGVAILGVVQQTSSGSSAGLESFIYGKTASMSGEDARRIALTAGVLLSVCALLFKEFKLLCFDAGYAQAQGWPTLMLDVLLMGLVTAITVVGLQAVGLILVIAMLIIPAAAARFWTERLAMMVVVSGLAGGAGAALGVLASAMLPDLPSGAVIVVTLGVVFGFSMVFGPERGVFVRWRRRSTLNRRIRRQHLLRAMFELLEDELDPLSTSVPPRALCVRRERLVPMRSWTHRQLSRSLGEADDDGLLDVEGGEIRFTAEGLALGRRIVRNHRLWELYLIAHADIAPSHVDRDADAIEHVLGADMVRELEAMLPGATSASIPASPHAILTDRSGGR
jgi:manganese/zinc/iron transport system permease protein